MGSFLYLMYVDESGDPGNNTTQSRYFCLTGLVVHESEWRELVNRLIEFRRLIKNQYGFSVRRELHAAELIRHSAFDIPKHQRLAILRNAIDELAKLEAISLTNVVVDKSEKPNNYDVFSVAWRTLFQRFENTLRHGNYPGGYRRAYGVVYTDATSGEKLSQIMRKMNSYNPIPNRYDGGYRNMPIDRVIEDPSPRNSAHSLLIQACDISAYFLQQKMKPNSYIKRKSAHNYFDRLAPVLNIHASTNDRQGIVRL